VGSEPTLSKTAASSPCGLRAQCRLVNLASLSAAAKPSRLDRGGGGSCDEEKEEDDQDVSQVGAPQSCVSVL
jgi:hypothetical protein